MRGSGITPGILAGSVLAWTGCDPPLCRDEPSVAFTQTRITGDVDAFAPGVQTDVGIESSLLPGDVVTLEVLDDRGTSLGTMSRTVDPGGGAQFDYVTVPAPRAVLRATARGVCGEARAEVVVDVPVAPTCALQVVPAPEVNAYYAPFGVLSLRSDPDPVTPGYQTTLEVATRPGWAVEILRDTGGEQSLGVVTAGGDGAVRMPVALSDGWVGLRAVCRGDGSELMSSPITLRVDTAPPDCAVVAPVPGSTITRDDDHDPCDGVQFTVSGRSAASDVAGELVTVTVIDASGASVAVSSTTATADGHATDEMTVAPVAMPASFDVALTMHDHAGNACTAVAGYRVSL